MSKKKNLVILFLCGILTAGGLLTLAKIASAAQPGLDLLDNGLGAATRTHNAANPFTAVQHWVKVVDYDSIADDGSSHTVTVSIPMGGRHMIYNFTKKGMPILRFTNFGMTPYPSPLTP